MLYKAKLLLKNWMLIILYYKLMHKAIKYLYILLEIILLEKTLQIIQYKLKLKTS